MSTGAGWSRRTWLLRIGLLVDGTLATGGGNNQAWLWDVGGLIDVREHAADEAYNRAGRDLDETEWAQYVKDLPYQQTCPS